MYLINVKTYELEWFVDEKQVPGGYAILSHRWEDEEILYKDITKVKKRKGMRGIKGFYKLDKTCQQAVRDELSYAWIDTCCIDKSSSAELQEAINSMFRWYQHAEVCYVYLSDVHEAEPITDSKWFSRGWTLQELLAPTKLIFYSSEWTKLSDRHALAEKIANTTKISVDLLESGWSETSDHPCAAEILFWASTRSTTRIEDASYCLLGLFDVNMPLIYGEGTKAFIRLQHEILRQSDDQSLFAWELPENVHISFNKPRHCGSLALSPQTFKLPRSLHPGHFYSPALWERRKAHAIDSEGISIEVNLLCFAPRMYLAITNADVHFEPKLSAFQTRTRQIYSLGVIVKRLDTHGRYSRIATNLKLGSQRQTFVPNLEADVHCGVGVVKNSFIGKMQVIKIMHSLRRPESAVLRTDYCAAIKMDIIKFSVREGLIVYRPCYEVQDDVISLKTPDVNGWGLAALIRFDGPAYKKGWKIEPPRKGKRIHYIGFGFDADFSPVIAFVLDSHLNWRQELGSKHLLSGEKMHSRIRDSVLGTFIEDEGSWTSTVKESRSLTNAESRTSYVGGTGFEFKQYDNQCLLLRLQLSAADNQGGNAKIFDWTSDYRAEEFCLDVNIFRTTPDEPWSVRIAEHKWE